MHLLDLYFPYIVFVYGIVMVLVTSSPALRKIAEEQFSQSLVQQFYGHQLLGKICFFVGFAWSLQRLFTL